MKLKTQRLILREVEERDVDDLVEGAGYLKVSGNLLVVPHPCTNEDAKWFISHCKEKIEEDPRKGYNFAVEFEGKMVGVVSLANVDEFNGTATLGLWLNEKYWRKGIMSEATIAVIDFAFDKLKLRRINSEAFSDNNASIEFQKSLGFKEEGLSRKRDKSKATGEIHDSVMLGLLKEDWDH